MILSISISTSFKSLGSSLRENSARLSGRHTPARPTLLQDSEPMTFSSSVSIRPFMSNILSAKMVSFTHNWLNYFVYKRLEYFYHSDSIKLSLGDLSIWSPIYRHPISFTIKVRVILLSWRGGGK